MYSSHPEFAQMKEEDLFEDYKDYMMSAAKMDDDNNDLY